MISETHARKSVVSLWLPIAVLFLGLIFFIFVVVEYQRNTALVEQNASLISNSAKASLSNSILSREMSINWGGIQGRYDWIQYAPQTYWFNNGVQEFPWARSPSSVSDVQPTEWKMVWSEINSLSSKGVVNEHRLTLLNAIKVALDGGDELIIKQAFDDYLEHKNAYHLSPQEELGFSLKLVEIGAQEHWSRELVHAILVTGGSSEAPLFRPVTDILFRRAELFSRDEFDLVTDKVKQQLEALNLSSYFFDDYLQHLDEPQFSLLLDINSLNSDVDVATEDGWLLQRRSETQVSADPFILSEELEFVESEFIELGVLDDGDSLILNDFAESVSIDEIGIDVSKAQLNNDRRNQTAYLIFKSAMLIAFVALILLTLRLIEKNQQRRLEYFALREDFVKLVSHELKTPLAGIRAMAETLRKRVERGLSVQSYPERIVSEADKLWYMVDNILGFNRVQLTNAIIDQRLAKLKPLCDGIVEDVRLFSQKPYTVKNTISESVEVSIDVELFSLVVKNIIVNAGLYNDKRVVEIGLSFDQSSRCLLVTDNGVGIADEDRFKVFKPFVRLTQSVRQSGTGLGLAICKRIMQLHEGDLSLAQSSSSGSVWKISLAM